MTDDFVSLHAYNRWADRLVLAACRKLSDEQYNTEPAPGWASVGSTVAHIAIVTEGWLRGLTGEVVETFPEEGDLPNVDAAERHLDQADRHFEGLVPRMTPEWLAAPMTLSGGGRTAVLPPWVVLRHVVNHATYHRGQIASKLRRFGVEPPATDLIFWAFAQGQPTS